MDIFALFFYQLIFTGTKILGPFYVIYTVEQMLHLLGFGSKIKCLLLTNESILLENVMFFFEKQLGCKSSWNCMHNAGILIYMYT